MNHTASDLSKDVASLIILDDRFATIVDGIQEGRVIYENLRKCIRYVLSHIMPVALGLGVFVITLIPVPITPLLIMVIDLLADIWPAISFAWEPAEGDLMLHKPRNINNVRSPTETEDTPHNACFPSTIHTTLRSAIGKDIKTQGTSPSSSSLCRPSQGSIPRRHFNRSLGLPTGWFNFHSCLFWCLLDWSCPFASPLGSLI